MLKRKFLTRSKKDFKLIYQNLVFVGMTGFEPATPRPPDVYSNRTELHPENNIKNNVYC